MIKSFQSSVDITIESFYVLTCVYNQPKENKKVRNIVWLCKRTFLSLIQRVVKQSVGDKLLFCTKNVKTCFGIENGSFPKFSPSTCLRWEVDIWKQFQQFNLTLGNQLHRIIVKIIGAINDLE